MSFDIFLMSFREGNEVPADREAALRILQRYDVRPSDGDDAYDIQFADGSRVEFFASNLSSEAESFAGGMLALRVLSPAIAEFIYELARAARLIIVPAMDSPCYLLTSNDLAAHVPDFKLEQKHVGSAEELFIAIGGGF